MPADSATSAIAADIAIIEMPTASHGRAGY